ncbi:MAG: TetR/AcrR family transcriptional regulator [Sciscionella sp.]
MISRRQRYREEMIDEAKRIACEQLAVSGPAGISVNAIAKHMGVTGPALYRYFGSRDALLTELIRDAYAELAVTLEEVARGNVRRAPATRLRELADAFRGWAVEQPHRYLLLYGTPVPGYIAPQDTIELANRALTVIATVIADLPGVASAPERSVLDRQLANLMRNRDTDVGVGAMRRAVLCWTRLHGIVSLEVQGQFEPTGVDPALLLRAEIDAVIAGGG